MKNGAKNIIAIGSGVCLLALWFVFLFFITKPYTEKIIIWLPDNYKLENPLQNQVVLILPDSYAEHQYSRNDTDSFKKLFGKSEMVAVKIEDASYSNFGYYRIIYQTKYDCADKSFFVAAQEYYRYNRKTLSEMRLRDGALFLKNKRDTNSMFTFSVIGFVVIVFVVFLYIIRV